MKEDRYGRLVKNSAIFAVANMSSKVLMFLLVPYYSYVLAPEEYGLADTLTSTVIMLLPLISLGLQSATVRFVMDKEYNTKSVISVSMAMVILTSLIFALSYPLLSYLDVYSEYLLIFYLLISVQSIAVIMGEFARGIDKLKAFAFSGVLQTIILCVLNILFLSVFKMGSPGEVYTAATGLLYLAEGHPNFVLSSGCDTPPGVPPANIDAFYSLLL